MRFNLLILLVLINACGVKEMPSQPANPPAVVESSLPNGIYSSKSKKYLIKPSKNTFSIDSKYLVSYSVIGEDLKPLSENTQVDVVYWMPSMPAMPVTPAVIRKVAPGNFEVEYDISMEGGWEFTLRFLSEGTLIDSFTVQYEVPALQ